jgi:electron transfer flavoprotein alpha subunit
MPRQERDTLFLVEEPGDLAEQALTFARSIANGASVQILATSSPSDTVSQGFAVDALHVAEHQAFASFAPGAVARALVELAARLAPTAIVASGTSRGNEVLARVAAVTDLPFAANCIAASGDRVTRVRWGGSLLEEAQLHGAPRLLTVQPHAVAADAATGDPAPVERFTPKLTDEDLVVRVRERVSAAAGGVSLAEAKVVVSCGRGAGSNSPPTPNMPAAAPRCWSSFTRAIGCRHGRLHERIRRPAEAVAAGLRQRPRGVQGG